MTLMQIRLKFRPSEILNPGWRSVGCCPSSVSPSLSSRSHRGKPPRTYAPPPFAHPSPPASQASTDRRELEKPAARTRRGLTGQPGPGFRNRRPDMDLDATACSQRGCAERHDFLPFTYLPSQPPCLTEQIKPSLVP